MKLPFSNSKQKIKNIIENSFLKKKDSLIGLPVLFALSGFANIRNAHKPDVVNKIALLKITSVRDTIFIFPALKALKQAYPNAKITFFAGEDNFNIASELHGVNNAIRLFSNDLNKSMKIIKNAGYFDLWIDFGVWSRFEAIMTQTAKATYKLGFKTSGEHRHFAYDKVADYFFENHLAKNYSYLLSMINIKVDDNYEIPLREDIDKTAIIDIFADNKNQENRKWPQAYWKEVVEYLSKQGYRVALFGDKKDSEEAEIFNELLGSGADIDFLVGRLDFGETIKLLKRTSIVISTDNALLHIASYLGVPVVGLYGPTDKHIYAPLMPNAHIVSSFGCSSCQILYGDEKCTNNMPDCMESIPVETVIKAINIVLGENVE